MFEISVVPMLEEVADALCRPAKYNFMPAERAHKLPMPDLKILEEVMERLRAAIFPGYHGKMGEYGASVRYHMAANLDSIYSMLAEQIRRGICFTCEYSGKTCKACEAQARDASVAFMKMLPEIRDLLFTDVKAAFEGDPAAKTPGETIFCYPSISAMTNHRIAHALYSLDVPLIPRILSEMAHSKTGIDLHPGAQVGEEFFIDHGTGVVIGETCIIGKRCRLYQGVTLGALSFVKDEEGVLVKGQPRHPILEDNVTVYAGATILGRVVIGKESIIGGNVWLTHSVPAGSRVVQQRSVAPEKQEAIVGKA